MKAIGNGSLAIILLVFVISTQMASGNDIEDFFKRTTRSLVKHHKKLLETHVSATRAVAFALPKPPPFNVRVKSSPRIIRNKVSNRNVRVRRSHTCRMINVRIWVGGKYERTVERQLVRYRNERGARRCHYEDVIIQTWIPGHYEMILRENPNCYCRRGRENHNYRKSRRKCSSDSYWR